MRLIMKNDEVFVAEGSVAVLGPVEFSFIRQQALRNERRRARICAHRTNLNPLHEMIIALCEGTYIHPHRHHNKSESFHIIDGMVDVVLFDDKGEITDLIELVDTRSGRSPFYRLDLPIFHTLILRTETLVMHEVTNGPFGLETTEYARFAPAERNREQSKEFSEVLMKRAAQFRESR